MSATVERAPRLSTGRLRALLAAGGVLMLTVGVTSAAFQDESRAVLTGPDGSIDAGVGYAEHPAIWLSDEGQSGRVVPPPSGRDHWMYVSNDVPISSNPDDTFEVLVHVYPERGVAHLIDVTPTLRTGIVSGPGAPDPFPWLRFTVTLPDGKTFENLSAAEFNAIPDRTFTVCNPVSSGGPGGCGYVFEMSVTLDILAPYTIRDAKADVRVAFEGMTTWKS